MSSCVLRESRQWSDAVRWRVALWRLLEPIEVLKSMLALGPNQRFLVLGRQVKLRRPDPLSVDINRLLPIVLEQVHGFLGI